MIHIAGQIDGNISYEGNVSVMLKHPAIDIYRSVQTVPRKGMTPVSIRGAVLPFGRPVFFANQPKRADFSEGRRQR